MDPAKLHVWCVFVVACASGRCAGYVRRSSASIQRSLHYDSTAIGMFRCFCFSATTPYGNSVVEGMQPPVDGSTAGVARGRGEAVRWKYQSGYVIRDTVYEAQRSAHDGDGSVEFGFSLQGSVDFPLLRTDITFRPWPESGPVCWMRNLLSASTVDGAACSLGCSLALTPAHFGPATCMLLLFWLSGCRLAPGATAPSSLQSSFCCYKNKFVMWNCKALAPQGRRQELVVHIMKGRGSGGGRALAMATPLAYRGGIAR